MLVELSERIAIISDNIWKTRRTNYVPSELEVQLVRDGELLGVRIMAGEQEVHSETAAESAVHGIYNTCLEQVRHGDYFARSYVAGLDFRLGATKEDFPPYREDKE